MRKFVFAAAIAALTIGFSPGGYAQNRPGIAGGDGLVRLGTLPPQELDEGQCALFLWVRESAPRLVFASLSAGAARVSVGDKIVQLSRSAVDGREFFGQFELQRFTGGGLDILLRMAVEPSPALVGGAVVPNATLRLRESNGWETVMPLGGLVGCQTQTN